MKYSDIYTRACKKGKLRKDEYTTDEFIDDINDLGRTLWTTIFQGVNGNKPKVTRKETITVLGDLNYVHTRTIKKTPILKIVYKDCTYLPQRTDKASNVIGDCSCFSFEYDDEEIRLSESIDGDYEVYYEAGTYTELTPALYTAGEAPDWVKDDFIPIFWSYCAFLNTDTRKKEMTELYAMHLRQLEKYYSRTETLEVPYMKALDTQNQL